MLACCEAAPSQYGPQRMMEHSHGTRKRDHPKQPSKPQERSASGHGVALAAEDGSVSVRPSTKKPRISRAEKKNSAPSPQVPMAPRIDGRGAKEGRTRH